jgi:endonuclease/exonuclease/phosphatase family metal-dependent hydrolase
MLVALSAASSTAFAVRIVTYNVLDYNGAGREAAFQSVFFETPTAGTETAALQADLVVLQEVLGSSSLAEFATLLNNGSGSPTDYTAATFEEALDTAVVYRSSLFAELAHTTISDGTHTINRWQLGLVGYASDAATVYVYAVHAPAGTDAAAQQARVEQALLIRQDANALPAGSRFLVAGDLQVRAANEASYVAFTDDIMGLEAGQTIDPLNPAPDPGNPLVWHAEPAFSAEHTESTREFPGIPCPPDCGMDDRFDFQLLSEALHTPVDFSYVPGTYRAYGNDGAHFGQAIDAGGANAAVGVTVAEQLRLASDHLPVLAEYQVPARVAVDTAFPTAASCEVTIDLGKIKQGQNNPALDEERLINIANRVDLGEYGFVETLGYQIELAGGLPSGPLTGLATPGGFPIADSHDAEDFNPPADPVGNDHTLTLTISDGAAFGAFDALGALEVTGNDVDCPAATVNISGEVIPYLNVNSNVPGVSMTVTDDVAPADEDAQGTASSGTSDFTLGYDLGTDVTITAQDPHPTDPDLILVRWDLDGAILGTSPTTAPITMDDSKTAEAMYGYVLTVDANEGATSIDVTDDVGDPDTDGSGAVNDGATLFTRRYEWDAGLTTNVTLTAQDPHPGNPSLFFLHWEVDGTIETTDTSVVVAMSAPRSALAVYALALDVDANVPATPIDVTDDDPPPNKDASGQNNDGDTQFTRVYGPGTTVTLVAPTEMAGRGFARWQVSGQPDEFDPQVQVLMDVSKTAVAVYQFDADADGDIDLDDLAVFWNCLTGPDPVVPPSAECAADFDGDGDNDVDLDDFGDFQAFFTG